ncbi:MAG: L-serine ammonia-lyase [Bacteroidetes bacterium]|nr:L-serine ammonia-lyase [Bacteroidota bacterium]
METISIFDMLKVGVGPSSSHTLGPWRAANRFIDFLKSKKELNNVSSIKIDLYGSLSLTGKGHATDIACLLGLFSFDPTTFPCDQINSTIEEIKSTKKLKLDNTKEVDFQVDKDLVYHRSFLPFHPNALTFTATTLSGKKLEETYYSIGGGFVVQEDRKRSKKKKELFSNFVYPVSCGNDLLKFSEENKLQIHEIILQNELTLRPLEEIHQGIDQIWSVMLASMYEGCHTEGILPGGLNVTRRAFEIHKKLIGQVPYSTPDEWLNSIRQTEVAFRQILKWVSCFALSVNEVNASMGRIVTAPTNGSAGVIPAVLMYYLCIENHAGNEAHIREFLLVASEVGSIFKKGATISAAMGGCQAEIGVSSAMAAAGLTSLLGGTPGQILMAAEIAMEHHLGLTCDPIGGLVQIPCIERNAMGAIKAINAAELALDGDDKKAKVSLDEVVNTMWQTAQDMNGKYKETSEGGLAINVGLSDC